MKNTTHPSQIIVLQNENRHRSALDWVCVRLKRMAVLGLYLLAAVFTFRAGAAPITWTNITGGVWSAATNWSPNSLPGSTDDVFITNSGTYTVTMDVSPTISSLTLGGVTGQQTLTNSSKTLSVSHASLVDTNGVLGMNNGTLSGAGSLTINGLVHWNGGSSGNGFLVTVQSNAVLNIAAAVTFSGVVTNWGTINWLAGTLSITTNGAVSTGTIWNQTNALFDIQCDQVLANGGTLATFHNAGLVRKRVTAFSTIFNVFLDNSGTVQVQTGSLTFAGGASLVGSFQANSGVTISINGGPYTLSSPPNFQGPGTVQISANLTLNAFTGSFTLSSGTLVGQNTIADTGIINFNGSNLGNGATLTIASNAVVNITSSVNFNGVVTNLGTMNWLGGTVAINTNGTTVTGTIWNQPGALFDIQCDQVLANGGPAIFHNVGQLRKHVTTGSTIFNVLVDNTGTLQAQTGTMTFPGGANLGGSFQANSGATINFNGGTYTLSSPPNFQGPGNVQITGGSLTLNAFSGTFTLSGANLVGQNTIADTGIINFNGSNLGNGATLTIASNAVVNVQTGVTFSGIVTNLGTINWLAGTMSINTNGTTMTGTIWNQPGALFDIQCDQVLATGGTPAIFHNAGLMRKHVTTGSTTFNVSLDNSGTLQAQTGVISLPGGYTESPTATLAISLSGISPGTGFGKIQFNSKPTLSGKFALDALNGYRPNLGDSFFVISYPSVAGDFTSFNGLDLGSGLRLAPHFSASGLTLVTVSYPIITVPGLTLDRSIAGYLVAWPVNFTNWQLQFTTNLVASSAWTTVPVNGINNGVFVATEAQGYFRLVQ